MRRVCPSAVSSALLLLLTACAPCHLAVGPYGAWATSAGTEQELLLGEFYPCGLCGDEYVAIVNPSASLANLMNWSISDGEGSVTFVGIVWLAPGGRHYLSWNSSSFSAAYGRPPDSWISDDTCDGNVSVEGSFRLADSGDSIELFSPSGSVVDYVAYGSTVLDADRWTGPPMPSLRRGEVARRIESAGLPMDTDSAADWFPFREFRYGFTDVAPLTLDLEPGTVVPFVSPDNSLDVVLEGIRSARSVIRLCAYEFSSFAVCEALARSAELGLDVRVLVDGAPAGGMSDDEIRCLSALTISGAQVDVLSGNMTMDRVQHVGPLHAKYAVFDMSSAVVMSENFVETGLPMDKLFGNRGWGLWMKSSAVASHLAALFDEDSRDARADVIPWRNDSRFDSSGTVPMPLVGDHLEGILKPEVSQMAARATLYVSPDCSPGTPFLGRVLESATTVDLEQFQADLMWISRWTGEESVNPIVARSAEMIRAGGGVRVLFDSCWFNVERNAEVADHLNAVSFASRGELAARLMDDDSPIGVLHNKGLIIDGRLTIVSSNNMVMSSFSRNREIAVAVDSFEIAGYFGRAFELDWYPDATPPIADAGSDVDLRYGESVTLESGASTDDRAIAWIYWDVDDDGIIDGAGATHEFVAPRPGVYSVKLTVVDTWGNRDSDIVSVRVRTLEEDLLPSVANGNVARTALLACAGAAGAGFGAFLARRLLRPRKVNQPRVD